MDAIDQRDARALKRFGCGDIRDDHEFLDQLVCFKSRRSDHTVERAITFQKDFALGQVEVQGLAFVARPLHRFVSGIEGSEHRFHQRLGIRVAVPIDGRLRLLVG